ncbi:MAG: flavodoxin domain-containing protein, partial [Muribaculaceae bacterium]|nr:flavodoxin domain-containing protein [Muribaculaceae bacterium]
MKKYGIFYASGAGHTADAARSIAKHLNIAVEDVHDVATTAPSKLGEYETAILGSPTYGAGAMHPK